MRNLVCLGIVLASVSARGYDQRVHVFLSTQGYGGASRLALAADFADASAVRGLRERLWRAGANAHDERLRRRFLERYPNLGRFDAWEMKRLFELNPDKRVAGFDDDVALPSGDARAVYAAASRLPDDDERNRDRFRHDDARALVKDGWGRPLPDDPATLEMGALSGLSSQAHAHYGLPKIAFSDEPSVLKSDPRRFAVPPTVHTFAAAFSDSYTALALLASRLPGGARLSLTLAGAAAHHIEDVANQIHTVQVGLYDFFVDAKIESYKEELLSAGGYLRPRAGFVSIGIDIIGNHHLLSEALYEKHLLAPSDPVAALTANAADDSALERALDAVPSACTGFGRAITEALIERSSYEGPEVYRAIRAAAQRRWSKAGQHFGENDDPDAALRPGVDLTRFYALEAAGAHRALEALRAYWRHFSACAATDEDGATAIAEALLVARLDALDAALGRARMFTAKPPEANARNRAVLAGYLVALCLLAGLVRRRLRNRR